ncbi:putative transcriptional regulator [Candidatus Hepatincola sp. Pdp]
MKSISIRLEDNTAKKIDTIATLEDRDRSYIINKAINNYIAHHEYIIKQINLGLQDIQDNNIYSEKEFNNIVQKKYSIKVN